jgi:hypothetical protein
MMLMSVEVLKDISQSVMNLGNYSGRCSQISICQEIKIYKVIKTSLQDQVGMTNLVIKTDFHKLMLTIYTVD